MQLSVSTVRTCYANEFVCRIHQMVKVTRVISIYTWSVTGTKKKQCDLSPNYRLLLNWKSNCIQCKEAISISTSNVITLKITAIIFLAKSIVLLFNKKCCYRETFFFCLKIKTQQQPK